MGVEAWCVWVGGVGVGVLGCASRKLFGCAIIFALWNKPPVVRLACWSIQAVIFKLPKDITLLHWRTILQIYKPDLINRY